jgi:steroid delta-isomerase-like uncharacterized protein
MEETVLKKASFAETQKNMKAYFETHDVKYVAEDAVFTHMGTGDEYRGKEAIAGMLHYMYHVAFDARATIKNTVVTEDHALMEANFVGKHIGEFAGEPATNKEVNVPLCVSYDLENGLIKSARVYMMGDVMMRQLTS